jgi:hypothetical protein
MNFISKILNRPKMKNLFTYQLVIRRRMLGSDLERKGIDEICIFIKSTKKGLAKVHITLSIFQRL